LLRKPRVPTQLGYFEAVRQTLKPKHEISLNSSQERIANAIGKAISGSNGTSDTKQHELQPSFSADQRQPRPPIIIETDRLPPHHTSLQEVSALNVDAVNNSRSLVKPSKARGPDPLPARQPKKRPTVINIPLDEDLQRYYSEPRLTLADFTVRLAADENVPIDNVNHTLCSRYTYDQFQKILWERSIPKASKLAVQDLQLPEDLSARPPRVPARQLVAEMAVIVKEQLFQVSMLLTLPMLTSQINASFISNHQY
jgi:hypothetical protein